MSNELSSNHMSLFEKIKQTDENGNEFWIARQLAKVLQYSDFRNFTSVVEKAKEACINSGQLIEDHLVELNEVVAVQTRSFNNKNHTCHCLSHFSMAFRESDKIAANLIKDCSQ